MSARPAYPRRIAFRFGLTGRRWGEGGPVVMLLAAREAAPAWFATLVGPLLAAGLQVIALDDPTDASASRPARIAEFAAAIEEAAVEIDPLFAVVGQGLGASAAALAMEHGLHVGQATLLA